MAAELPRPGVEVIEQFASVTPTVVTPTLVPCVVGVCKQIVGATTTTASGGSALNTQALVTFSAQFIAAAAAGSPPEYTGLDGLELVLSINSNPNLTVTFAGSVLTPQQVVAQILAAFGAAGVTAATAELIGLPGVATQFRVRTFGANEFQTIDIMTGTSPAVLAAFGLAIGRIYSGASYYAQDQIQINTAAFPDPNKNLAQVVIDPASVNVYLFLGSGANLLQLQRTSSFLRSGLATSAVETGSVDMTALTYPTDLDTLVLNFKIDSGATLTVTFAAPGNLAAALAQINAVIGTVALATTDSVTHHLIITSLSIGPNSSVQVLAGSAASVVGLAVATHTGATAVASIDQGNGTAVTPIIQLVGANLTASSSAAVVTGTTAISSVVDGHTLIVDDGTGVQTLSFLGASTAVLILAQINGLFGPAGGGRITATKDGSSHLILTNALLGVESTINILGGTALTELGITVKETFGNPFPPTAGDLLYVGGVLYATISQVAPGGAVDKVKINKQVAINADIAESWYIISQGITSSNAQHTKPTPDLEVDGLGNVTIKQDILRNTIGSPLAASVARAQVYVAYTGVRQDVSALAKGPSLLSFHDTTALATTIGPISAANPLALGLYFALLNAPGTQVTGIGVDAVSGDSPYGTVEAFNTAATFLEAYEVYAIAPLTHDPSVAQVFNTHVTVMSEPVNKGERISLYNPSAPTNKVDTLIASGLSGNTLPTPNYFDTGIPNLASLLLANNITPGSFLVSQGIYLDIGDGNHYSIASETGSQVVVKTSGFLPGDNTDGFYATTALPAEIGIAFAVRVRGAALVLPNGAPDLDNIALTYQQLGQSWGNRRFWQIIPDACAATLGGLEQRIEGFYMCAAIAGMIGAQPPQQSFTNFPMTGFTRVFGSNGFLTEPQLNVAAAGGNYIVVQNVAGAPLISRMALTTDLTSIETRTDSITKVVDFSAKFLRTGLNNFIGRFNITQGFLDSLGHVIQGLLGFLADAGTLIGSTLNNIIQDTSAPDTVLIEVTLDVPFPCNYLKLTLVV